MIAAAAHGHNRRLATSQRLTQDLGHPELREHLSSVVTIWKFSKTPEEFKANVNMIYPKLGDSLEFDFKYEG